MAEKTITEIIKVTDHPLEDFFNMESNSTEIVKKEQKTELVKTESYDDKDDEIEEAAQTIYDEAMSGYDMLQEQLEDMDPRYAARGHEVANQKLQTALDAVKIRADLKKHKDKINKTPKSNTTNTIIMDTNSLIEELRKAKAIDVKAVDVTPIENTNNDNKG